MQQNSPIAVHYSVIHEEVPPEKIGFDKAV